MIIEIIDLGLLVSFWIAFCRMLAIITQLPLFNNTEVPSIIKILSVLMMTYSFFPNIKENLVFDVNEIGVEHFWILTMMNVLVGLFIGFMVKIIMMIFTSAGAIITQQIGFSSIRYFDTTSISRIGPFEKLIQWTMIVLVITSDALLPMFRGILSSFNALSLIKLNNLIHSPQYFLNVLRVTFNSALMLASPLIFINLLIMSVLGVISRMVPQMNIIMTSFVVNIGLGLLIFLMTSFEFFSVSMNTYIVRLSEWYQIIS